MTTVIEARRLRRQYGDIAALDGIDLAIPAGSIVGLIGPNGAGKTTLLRSLLGLTRFQGDLSVLGYNPTTERPRLMQEVSFIADTAVLPRWMTVGQLFDYVAGVHSHFDRQRAEHYLASTQIASDRNIGGLSKGMTVQVHLALVMSIDARLLVLDEPTLGLDILFRKRFFDQLVANFFTSERTIIISTHQVEEVSSILTHLVFMNRGKIILNQSMAAIAQTFVELQPSASKLETARDIPHLGSRMTTTGPAFIYQDIDRSILEPLGDLNTPSVSDIFVAMLGEADD
ncbi:MAG: ABC transporter ATP-binding protein [Halioglobus sp.]